MDTKINFSKKNANLNEIYNESVHVIEMYQLFRRWSSTSSSGIEDINPSDDPTAKYEIKSFVKQSIKIILT